eukprot:m.789806 g.789806  ORF g.789806 m.789806 type:complete len:238 (-) comp23325_c0_seq4:1956-2669(-)
MSKDRVRPSKAASEDLDVAAGLQFFDGLKTDKVALASLGCILKRDVCSTCGSSRKFFCYDCRKLVGLRPGIDVPRLDLPFRIDIIKHPNERNSKSTAIHAKLLAGDHVSVFEHPDIPSYTSDTLLVFPGPSAARIEDVNFATISNVVFVDSTWFQCASIMSDERLSSLKTVKISAEKTMFWRPQLGKPDTCLATIEAIYYFLREYATARECLNNTYDGRYDNMLFWFEHQYKLIHSR